ncbi:ABC transporter substrate-binding protein [Glaciimonas sp. PCH181]|uniref:ABC transporter substrate-binding protein n=1 Tax=Glaciimonas sp. PCH181 TaxID=2133943 RepID=UPI000D36BE9B|nr:ABC transporter substrate-binding protein [Glaciimonas sp. PCH181]PUA19847.1 nitrate ABC transporter substrate-binding protein [Glaciimonas sp. PCH181]
MNRFVKKFNIVLFVCAIGAAVSAQAVELRIAKQPGLTYLPTIIMEQNKLIEKHAAAMGIKDLNVSWRMFNSGASFNDSLISGNIDMAVAGTTNLILLWSKTQGAIKGYAGVGAIPLTLVTRNPNIKTVADFAGDDRIAVPTVKLSSQAIVLQMAAEKELGLPGRAKINALTVSMGHPDGVIAMQNKSAQITSHFTMSPYTEMELKQPGVRKILTSNDVLGGPMSIAIIFGSVKFHDKNPEVVLALNAALDEALDMIAKDKSAAAAVYLTATKDKTPLADMVKMLEGPDMLYSKTPANTMKMANYFAHAGYIQRAPTDWKEMFFPETHKLNGN